MIFTETHWSAQIAFPILSVIQLFPLFAMLVVFVLRDYRRVLPVGLFLCMLELLLVIVLYSAYDAGSSTMQFAETVAIYGPVVFHSAVDGVSILFMLLSALLTLLVAVYGPIRGLGPPGALLGAVFAIEATLMALFSTVNLMWFIALSVMQVSLVGYLLWRWSPSPQKDMALTRFYQFMGLGILLLLVGTLMLGWNHAHETGRWSFDLYELASVSVDDSFRSVVFFLLFYGFAIRSPLFPLHGWLPIVAEHGNIAMAPTLLLGIKVGIYGLLRFVFPLLPEAVSDWHAYVVAFAVVGIFYAAILAMMQNNMRRLLAFAVVSHTSLIVIGLFSLHTLAFQGSVLLSITFGLAIASLMFMQGLIFRRTGTTLLHKLGGLFDSIPFIGIAFFISGLAIIGMPGTPGFDAVHLILEASIERFGALLTIAAALGNVVAAGFLLWAFQRAFLAPRDKKLPPLKIEKMSRPEFLVAGAVVFVLLGAGFYSEPWIELISKPLEALGDLYE